MKKKLAELKQKIKDNAPVILSATAAVTTAVAVAATAYAVRKSMDFEEARTQMSEGFDDNELIKAAWREMNETGEDQLFNDNLGRPLFKMTKIED
jgi:hypothetical protein